MTDLPASAGRIKLRKYRNRRYYDITRSLHVTLEDIYELVCQGSDVEVTDSQTGEDITGRILTQIILDYEPLKLGVFPDELLHQVIRASEPLMRQFVEKYFNQALTAYLESQRQFDRYLRQAMGLEEEHAPAAAVSPGKPVAPLGMPMPPATDWMRLMFWPFAPVTEGGPMPEGGNVPEGGNGGQREKSPSAPSEEAAATSSEVSEIAQLRKLRFPSLWRVAFAG